MFISSRLRIDSTRDLDISEDEKQNQLEVIHEKDVNEDSRQDNTTGEVQTLKNEPTIT